MFIHMCCKPILVSVVNVFQTAILACLDAFCRVHHSLRTAALHDYCCTPKQTKNRTKDTTNDDTEMLLIISSSGLRPW